MIAGAFVSLCVTGRLNCAIELCELLKAPLHGASSLKLLIWSLFYKSPVKGRSLLHFKAAMHCRLLKAYRLGRRILILFLILIRKSLEISQGVAEMLREVMRWLVAASGRQKQKNTATKSNRESW